MAEDERDRAYVEDESDGAEAGDESDRTGGGNAPDRVEGVDFTDVGPILEEIPYPITTGELVAEYGDHSIRRTNAGPITIRELFEPMGEDTSTSADELRQSILTLMPKESVGRQRYSDRGLTIDDDDAAPRRDRPLPGHDREEGQP